MPDKNIEAALTEARAALSRQEIEEGVAFAPEFDADGLIVCITRQLALSRLH